MSSTAVPSRFGGLGRALSNPDYRLYWLGQLVSVQGVWINRYTALTRIFLMTESKAWLGILGFGMLIPMMLLAPIAGALADTIGHRRTAITATVGGIFLSGVMVVLTLMGQMTPVRLAVLFSADSNPVGRG